MDEQEKAADTAREQTIRGLRDLADFLERNPQVPSPPPGGADITAYFFGAAIEDQRAKLQEIARLAGRSEKRFCESYVWVQLKFGAVVFRVVAHREAVCRRVTREKVLPAEAEKVIPAQPERTVTEVEWVCDEPLLADG